MLDLVLNCLPFAVSASVTPGPNNVMVTASGANFGFRRTLPHLVGIAAGFTAMVLAIGFGLGALFDRYPLAHAVMRWVGAAYLLYLAWRIARARALAEGAASGRPFTAWEAALFQWLNPKGWVIAVGAVSTYTTVGGDVTVEIPLIAAVFGAVCFLAVALWAGFGVALRAWLRSPRALAAFNMAMAALLVASLAPLLL
jgi:threonine/homoserine/homoserine lactone efflux protein